MPIKVRYFAWLRERIGHAEELVDVPADVTTVCDLATLLSKRSPEHAAVFMPDSVIRVAVDQVHCKPDAPIAGAREVAFFPPVTGG